MIALLIIFCGFLMDYIDYKEDVEKAKANKVNE